MKKKLLYIGYWILQCTWGAIMTLIGAIAALIFICMGEKPSRIGPNVYFTIGKEWGGVSLGPFIFCSECITDSIKYHEYGHSLQNIIWGPLFPFIIGIPSMARYWLRTMPTRMQKSLFNLFFLLGELVLTTLLACITGPCLHLHWTTIGIEILRVYLSLVSIWLTLFEIPKYDVGQVDYDSIWFEGQATTWGTKMYKEKELNYGKNRK